MDNPFTPPRQRRRDEPTPPKNTFQRELEDKMRERKARGLSADLSDELESDNELMSQFDMTKKPRSNRSTPTSAYSGKTSPWQPRGGKNSQDDQWRSPSNKSHGEDIRRSPYNGEDIRRSPYNGEHADSDTRKAPFSYDSEEAHRSPYDSKYSDERRSPYDGHSRHRQLDDHRDKSPSDKDLRKSPLGKKSRESPNNSDRRQSAYDVIFGKGNHDEDEPAKKEWTPPGYKANRFNEDDGRSEARDPRSSSPAFVGRKTPTLKDSLEDDDRPRPTPRTRSKKQDIRQQPSPKSDNHSDGRRTPSKLGDGRRTPSKLGDGRKTPEFQDDRKTPSKTVEGTKTPTRHGDWHDRTPRPQPRRGSRKGSDAESEDEMTQRRQDRGGRTSHRNSPYEDNKENKDTREGRSGKRTPAMDRESSMCDDIERDPNKRHDPTSDDQRKPVKQRHEKKVLDDAINSVKNAQDGEKQMRYIDPDEDGDEEAERKKKNTSQNKTLKVKPKPRYGGVTTKSADLNISMTDFNSTSDIRDAVYQDWYHQRMESARQEKINKSRKEKEEEENKRKEKQDKILEAKVSYQAWLENKRERDKGKTTKKKRDEEQKRLKDQEEKEQKRKEAELIFKRWKEDQDVIIKERKAKQKHEEDKKLREEQRAKLEKEKDAQNAFKGWKSRKDEKLIQDQKAKKKQQLQEIEDEEYAKEAQEEEAKESYERWIARKEKAAKKKARKNEDEEPYLPPWSPANRTIPVGR